MYYLSISDLCLVEGFQEAFGNGDWTKVKEILFQNGMDVEQGYETRYCQHRNLRNQVVTCERFEGEERRCHYWLKESGCASLDAWINSTGDGSFKDEMLNMSRTINRSGERDYDSSDYDVAGKE